MEQKMIKVAIAVLICLALSVVTLAFAGENIPRVDRILMDACVPPEDGKVVCDADGFHDAGASALRVSKMLEDALSDLTAVKELAEADVALAISERDVALSQVSELADRVVVLREQIESPWNSWWLWLMIGAASGAAVTGILLAR